VARLIHLNGAPGVGKSTLAQRYAAAHPGVLVCDVDVLRTMISGWERDPDAAGRSRTTALAMITAYLSTGYDVVLPQLVAREDQLARFTAAAEEAGAEHVHVMLVTDPETVVRRFRERASKRGDAWTAFATAYWDNQGGDEALREWVPELYRMDALSVPSTDPDTTYHALLLALGQDL
jgi:predicted kinase